MDAIYLILKSVEKNYKMLYDNDPISFAVSEAGANEFLRDSLPLLERVYPDLKVLGQDTNWLHITYTDLESGEHTRAIYTVRKVYNTTLAL